MNRTSRITRHKVPTCTASGLDRYRDRHQARDAAEALSRAAILHTKYATFSCPNCRGFHLETLTRPLRPVGPTTPAPATDRPSRYILVDIENLVGGRATREEARDLWRTLVAELDVTQRDQVVVGGNRHTARKLSPTIAGPNIGWVVGSMGADGADRALRAAVNLFQIAKNHDELVIMSGDHAFADLARCATKHGLKVRVVTTSHLERLPSLSRELKHAADDTTTVPTGLSRARSAQTPAA
ncbi:MULTISPECIES: NYN domain-containing protein [unclassified Nocardioides]|uniref:NYN domain-containing protein n=1 Tax=unclassified Nocardioides TaxID=2615069 RepID=UPI0006FDD568|nr:MULTISPECIES: NYN domain-containing protein [unclassified Nocardioides]KRA37966.1 hypothetical protein ASD81_04585 [Nocardioides sp. Root614]KRA91926.1 hypothetical protein ASD84_04850 [Nocardioides sp. Root682]